MSGSDQETFDTITRRSNDRQQEEVAADYGNEAAGRATGRMKRHLPGEASPEAAQKRRDEDARRMMSALEQMLLDPVYRARYEVFGAFLSEAESKADTLIEQAEAALAAINAEVVDAIDAAPKLNGKAIFRFADGRVIDEDGNEIPPELSQGIIWPDGAMSADEFAALLDRREHADTQLRHMYNFRTDLGEIRHRYDDEGNPITVDEMDALEADMRQRLENYDSTLKDEVSVPERTATAPKVETITLGN